MPELGRPTKPAAQKPAKPARNAHQIEAQDLDPVRATVVPNKGRNSSGVATVLDPRRPHVERNGSSKRKTRPKNLLEQALAFVRPKAKPSK